MRLCQISLATLLTLLTIPSVSVWSQQDGYSRQDHLRGSITPERAWWDLRHYTLNVDVFPETKSLKGDCTIRFKVLQAGQKMQIDLQEPLKITAIDWSTQTDSDLSFEREGNVYWVSFPMELAEGTEHSVKVFYEGVPVESTRPPWSGGLTWQKDEKGNDFIATTCQGDGASMWWPCKDHGYDEPDEGVTMEITVPEDLVAVGNGRLIDETHNETDKRKSYRWQVTHPINNYCVNMNIGNYVNFSETFEGEGGTLDMDYWVLAHQKDRAQAQFKEAPRTIKAFEHWFRKYPFYEDSFKLVSVPYLGMEHQSSVTYGNGFKNGYRGRDLSDTGVGLLFDFIIVHETGHEWFGNNISMKDAADMWIHESFTNYSENLFVEYHFDEEKAQDYVIGCRRNVQNQSPIIGVYNVNQQGSGDMYYKGGNMLHMIRHIIDDTDKWREILRGLNSEFWHQTVTTEQIEDYINQKSGVDFSKLFDQYLRETAIPVLRYTVDGNTLTYHLEDAVDGFAFPVKVSINGQEQLITPRARQQSITWEEDIESFELDRNFYLEVKQD